MYRLGQPNALIFDETYYAKDAYSLLKFGYERNWAKNADASIVAGNPDVCLDTASFIVHPQLGKWLIAAGEYVFGMNSVGWRVGPLIFGTLLVLILIRLVRRVSRSTLIGGLAGLSAGPRRARVRLVPDRPAGHLPGLLPAGRGVVPGGRSGLVPQPTRGPSEQDRAAGSGRAIRAGSAVVRPWRIAAGVCFGLALGCKWNAIYVMAAFALLVLAWDVGARRLAGSGGFRIGRLFRDGIPAFVSLVIVAIPVYVATWASWLASSGGYHRDWGRNNPDAWSVRLLGEGLASLLRYHQAIWDFHTGDFINNATHSYDAQPGGWLIIARPLSMYVANDLKPGTAGCTGPDNCISVVLAIGTPALWWAGVVALIAAAILWIGARDWRFGIPVVGVLAGWLPWFSYSDRPMFYFYAIAIVPFTIMAIALCLGRLIGDARAGDRRMLGTIVAGSFVALVGANFAYLYPILADQVTPYPEWRARMWFRSWI